jgi:hypothetical protein
MMRDRPDTLAQRLFIYQFLKILNSFQISTHRFIRDLTETAV